jgi:uncharacterized NAD-dependent epimerase/dehydratase family protein
MRPDGNAIVYCEGAFGTTNGKTAHGLVRRTARYAVTAVVDSRCAGKDAGEALDGKLRHVPVVASVEEAIARSRADGRAATHLVIGLAPDGGRLSAAARADVKRAIEAGLNVDAGLHDFLTEDAELTRLAAARGVTLRDIRKPPPRADLHFWTGKIDEVDSVRIAVLGTDSAIGKRTTAWILADALNAAGRGAVMVGTGQTAWMQGAEYSILLDSLVNDFVTGEIEHVVWRAWHDRRPDVIVIEGQGSLMNPAYPGGYEILAAARPHFVVLQHAPARREYDGFPGYPLHPLAEQIRAIELVSGRPVAAVTVNHERLARAEAEAACRAIREGTGLPAHDVLLEGGAPLVTSLAPRIDALRRAVPPPPAATSPAGRPASSVTARTG